MKKNLDNFNKLNLGDATYLLLQACHCGTWAQQVLEYRPFYSFEQLILKSSEIFLSLNNRCWLEAFQAHPKIGSIESLKEKFKSTSVMAKSEQKLVTVADVNLLHEVRKYNEDYEKKFGFIFIVFASGKSALEILNLLKDRINNSLEDELQNAAIEQNKITNLRLEKLL